VEFLVSSGLCCDAAPRTHRAYRWRYARLIALAQTFRIAAGLSYLGIVFLLLLAGCSPPTLKAMVLTPANQTIASGATLQFTATGTFSDGSAQNLTSSVTWSSATPSVATITTGGLATGVSAGSSSIKAASNSIMALSTLTVSASATVYTVTPSGSNVTISPRAPQSVSSGATQTFTVTSNSGYSLSSTVGGTCPQGSWSGSTYTTGAITANCSVSFSASTSSTALEDEFVGPFPSWINVKTVYRATGNGVTDDTTAIQNALNALVGAGGGTLYFPAGTYIISRTLSASAIIKSQIIGQDPSTTIIRWAGPSGGVMLQGAGYGFSKEGRITWDGSGTAETAVYHNSGTSTYSTDMSHFDEVFENVGYGLRIGSAVSDDAEETILRCHFINNTSAGVSVESWNALDIWVWYSTFQNDAIGITNVNGAGGFNAYYNSFSASSKADILIGNTIYIGIRGNYSSGSNQFFHENSVGQNTSMVTLQGNTILNTINPVAIEALNPAQLKLIDNTIRSQARASAPAVSLQPQGGAVGGDLISVGNTFSVSSPESVVGTQTDWMTLNDQVVSYSQISGTPLDVPTPPNLNRRIIEVAAGSNAATIQAAITSAVAYQGSRPAVHLPAGIYSIASSITIPSNLDVQIIGDGYGTQLSWSGASGGAIFTLQSPSKALVQDMYLNAASKAIGFLIGSEDVPGSRIQVRDVDATNGQNGILAEGLTNTRVNLYGYSDNDEQTYSITGTGVSAPSQVACFGCGMGGHSGSAPRLNVSQDGNLLIEDTWFEGCNTTMATLTGAAGNVTIDDNMFSPKCTNSPASVTLNNYSGNFAWMNSQFQAVSSTIGAGPIVVTNPTASTNSLFMGDLFVQAEAGNPVWTVAAGGNVYGRNNSVYVSRSGSEPKANLGGTASSAFMLQMLNQMSTVLPSLNTALPSGISDVQISKVWINNPATTAIQIKPGL
jgi:hypothetical protein